VHRLRRTLDTLGLAPFEAMLGTVGIISGAATILGTAPPSIHQGLPAPMVLAWGVILIIGSLLILTGLTLQQLRVEQAGLVLLAATTLIYGAAIIVVQPAAALTPAATYVLFAAACLLRIRVLTQAMAARTLPESEAD